MKAAGGPPPYGSRVSNPGISILVSIATEGRDAAKRKLTMRQLRQMLRLARDGASSREIARVLGVARSTVQENLKRAMDAGLGWPLPGELTDDALEQRLFERAGSSKVPAGVRSPTGPSWPSI